MADSRPKPLLVGECNPYNPNRDDYALYPYPERASGDRLCRLVMGLEPDEYLRRFDRTNLCQDGRWSQPEARARAGSLLFDAQVQGRTLVLCGQRVCRAFGLEYRPSTVERQEGATLVLLAHPSGLCRHWNAPGALAAAREALRLGGALP